MEKGKGAIDIEVKKGLTLKALIIGGVLAALVSAWVGRIGVSWFYRASGYYWYQYGISEVVAPMGVFMVAMIIIALINHLAKRSIFTAQEVSVILMMTLIGPWLLKSNGWNGYQRAMTFSFSGWARSWSPTDMEVFMDYIPSTVTYKNSEYWQAVGNNYLQAIDWAPIIPSIFWWALTFTSLALTTVFMSLLLRRLFIDVEALEFPIAEISSGFVSLTQPEDSSGKGRVKLFTSKLFWIGFAIQAIWLAAVTYPHSIPWFTEHLPGSGSPWNLSYQGYLLDHATIVYPVDQLNRLGMIIPWSPLNFALEPWQLGWSSVLSLDTLVGIVLGWLIWWIIYPSIKYAIGIYGEEPSAWRLVAHGYWGYANAPGTMGYFMLLGLWLGVGLVPLWKNRHIVIPVLKGLFTEPAQETDPNKPISYRWAWIGFIGCFVLTLLMAAIGYIDVITYLICLIPTLIIYIGVLRVMIETGGLWGAAGLSQVYTGESPFVVLYSWMGNHMYKANLTPGFSLTATTTSAMTSWWFFDANVNPLSWTTKIEAGGITNLHAMKLGQLTHTSLKDMLKVVIVTIIIAVFTATLYNVLRIHIYTDTWNAGLTAFAGIVRNLDAGILPGTAGAADRYILPREMEAWALIIIGFLVAAAFPYARRQLRWFRIGLSGFVLGIWMGWFMWASTIAALIIKYLILRTGGMELYETKWKPLAFGLMAGGFIMVFLGGWLPSLLRDSIIQFERMAQA